jgi:hypothetical protein
MSKTVAEARHLERIAGLGCILHRHITGHYVQAEVHHLKEGQGLSQRASHFLTVPLCPECHRGPNGLHGLGTKGFYTRYNLDELDLLAMTIEALEREREHA